jgi:hypothetical protein
VTPDILESGRCHASPPASRQVKTRDTIGPGERRNRV